MELSVGAAVPCIGWPSCAQYLNSMLYQQVDLIPVFTGCHGGVFIGNAADTKVKGGFFLILVYIFNSIKK